MQLLKAATQQRRNCLLRIPVRAPWSSGSRWSNSPSTAARKILYPLLVAPAVGDTLVRLSSRSLLLVRRVRQKLGVRQMSGGRRAPLVVARPAGELAVEAR